MNDYLSLIKLEFDTITGRHESLATVLTKNTVKLFSNHNLHDIEPFYAQLQGELIKNPSFITDEHNCNPDDSLYVYRVDSITKNIRSKRLIVSKTVYYETFFYTEDHLHKSITFYVNRDQRKAFKICYLHISNEIPIKYVECSEHGIVTKEYISRASVLIGYTSFFHNFIHGLQPSIKTNFIYNTSDNLEAIEEFYIKNPTTTRTLYQNFKDHKSIKEVLKTIEDYLVQQIHLQITTHTRIDKPVFCIVLEYSLQTVFPPNIGIGQEKERTYLELAYPNLKPWDHYNAKGMNYYSKNESLHFHLHNNILQKEYKFIEMHSNTITPEKYESWKTQIHNVYIRVAKRLQKKDFSDSFYQTDDFLVMVRNFEEYDNEKCYRKLQKYRMKDMIAN